MTSIEPAADVKQDNFTVKVDPSFKEPKDPEMGKMEVEGSKP